MAEPKVCPICKGRGSFLMKPTKEDEKKGYKNRLIRCDSCDGTGILSARVIKLPGT